MALTNLDLTRNYANGKVHTQAFLNTPFDELETMSANLNNNLTRAGLDMYGTAYSYDDTATAKFSTINLHQKQTQTKEYTGGNISCNTTGSWTDVDATNAADTVTVLGLTGDFKVTCTFTFKLVLDGNAAHARYIFRLTDGSTSGEGVSFHYKRAAAHLTAADEIHFPVTVSAEFANWSAAAHTVKLQYYSDSSRTGLTTSAVVAEVVDAGASANSALVIYAEKI